MAETTGSPPRAGELRDIAAERAAIDRAVAGRTLPNVLLDVAERYPDLAALKWRSADGWQSLTWTQYRERVRDATLGLRALGFAPDEFGLILVRNRPEHLIADLGLVHARGRSISVYNTLAPEQIAYIANHSGATVAFVEGRDFLAKFVAIREQCPSLRRIVLIDGEPEETGGWVVSWQEFMDAGRRAAMAEPAAFDALWQALKPDDIVSLIYTSGTTGSPKGVTYTHYNILWTLESSRLLAQYEPGERLVSYLPLAHVAERFTSHWGGIYNVAATHLVPDTALLLPALLDVRPQLFVGVPRVWEKFQTGLRLGLAAEQDEQRRTMLQAAIATGYELVERQSAGQPIPPELAARAKAAEPILTLIRGKIGLDQCRTAYTSTAPTPLDVLTFFAALGLPIYEVWGMSELTGPATANPRDHAKLGTVGTTLPGVEAKIGEDGELLIRGGNVMPAYYKDPERTAEAFDEEGWLRTGDVAIADDEGYFRIVDRKKELIITSSGKNLSPANIEALLKHNPLIGQAFAVGDGHSYICALLVLDTEVAPAWARAHGIAAATLAELAANPLIVEEVCRAVEEANKHLSRIEQVKRFTILPAEWTAESEELTPTLKLKRRVIREKYQRQIEGMYADEPSGYEVTARAEVGSLTP